MSNIETNRTQFFPVKEKFNPIHLLSSKLLDIHHPYGLFLMSAPFLSGAGAVEAYTIDSAGLSLSSYSVESCSDTHPGTTGKLLKDTSSAGALGLSFSGYTPETSLSSTGLVLSFLQDHDDQFHIPLAFVLSSLAVSTEFDPHLAQIFKNSFEFTVPAAQNLLIPIIPASHHIENQKYVNKRIEIHSNRIRVGCVTAKACVYEGQKEFTVISEILPEPYILKPGDIFLILHVNHGGGSYAHLEPIARIRAIKKDFQAFCKLLENDSSYDLTSEEQKILQTFQTAPLIGISHLVRLMSTYGLPTWNIQMLPKALQYFHKLDSQIVSHAFGGRRKVKTEDIKVVFIPPYLRSQLV